MRTRALGAATLLPLLVAMTVGCGQGETADRAAAGPSSAAEPSTASERGSCQDSVASDVIERLTGESVGEPRSIDVGGLDGCRWDSSKSSSWVQVVRLPAATWAEALPELFEQVKSSGMVSGDNLRKLEEGLDLLESGELDDDGACRLFTTMVVDIQGQPDGSEEIVNYVPTKDDPLGVNAQSCRDGVYASVQLVAPDIEVSTATNARMLEAMAAVLEAS